MFSLTLKVQKFGHLVNQVQLTNFVQRRQKVRNRKGEENLNSLFFTNKFSLIWTKKLLEFVCKKRHLEDLVLLVVFFQVVDVILKLILILIEKILWIDLIRKMLECKRQFGNEIVYFETETYFFEESLILFFFIYFVDEASGLLN